MRIVVESVALYRGKVIHLIDVGIHVSILDKLARSGTDALGADTWAELDPGVKFLCIITLITFLPSLLFTILSLGDV